MQGELAGLRTKDLRKLKRFLHSKATTEQQHMIMHSKLLLQKLFDLGSNLGYIRLVLPSKFLQLTVNPCSIMKVSASPYSHQFIWEAERSKWL